MKQLYKGSLKALGFCLILILLLNNSATSQTIMFDDFNYSSVDDGQLSSFNKWNIVNGTSGPPEGAQYSRNNIQFISDPSNANNRLMTLSTTVNGSTKATTHSRIETGGFEYFAGTYAARVFLSDVPFTYKDANIQTFFTIVSSALAQDGTKYSELDIVEYMAADKWGISPDNPVTYTTSYHKYIANPWKPWKVYTASTGSKAGWHTFMAQCTDGVNVRYFMDGNLIATHSVTDSETQAGLPVYPRSNMHIAFANWIWNNVVGGSTANRTTTMQVDWVLHYKNQALTPQQVNDQVNTFRSQGIQRRNLLGQTFTGPTSCNATPITPYLAVNGGAWQQTASATLNVGGSVAMGPAPTTGGSWSWTGPGGFTASTREITRSNIQTAQAGNYVATHTNACGARSTQTFTITVNGGTTGVTTVYKDCNYGGYAVGLPVGDYTLSQLNARGVLNKDISSLRVTSGYRVTLFETDNFGGASVSITADNSCLVANGWNDRTTSLRVASTTSGTFTSTIEAESYTAMLGIQTEACSEGTLNVGWIETGDWMAYNVNIPSAGTYKIIYRVASPNTGTSLRLEKDAGATNLGTVAIPNTGGWQNWTNVSHNVTLPAGQYAIGIATATGGFNINKFTITNNLAARLGTESADLTQTKIYPNPVRNKLYLKNSLEGTSNIQVLDLRGNMVQKITLPQGETEADLSNLSPGSYIIKITGKAGVTVEKITKE